MDLKDARKKIALLSSELETVTASLNSNASTLIGDVIEETPPPPPGGNKVVLYENIFTVDLNGLSLGTFQIPQEGMHAFFIIPYISRLSTGSLASQPDYNEWVLMWQFDYTMLPADRLLIPTFIYKVGQLWYGVRVPGGNRVRVPSPEIFSSNRIF